MKKYFIITWLCFLSFIVSAQNIEQEQLNKKDSVTVIENTESLISLGYHRTTSLEKGSSAATKISKEILEKSPELDVMKALYGRVAGLNVYQGSGIPAHNQASFSINGHAPLVLVDGYPRDISSVTMPEIESVTVLKDAVAAALYGVRGANGVVLVTTKRGINSEMKVTANYQFGINRQYRTPVFADSYTYANNLNTALGLDGLGPRYNANELEAFKSNNYPYAYPNVNWKDEVYNDTGYNHQLALTFSGGKEKFKFFTAVNYSNDKAMFNDEASDSRYNTTPTDVKLNLRTNLDINLTKSTLIKFGIMGRLREINGSNKTYDLISSVYRTPSAAFPIKTENGIFGGNTIYGANNPVALNSSSGHNKNIFASLFSDLHIRQDLDIVTPGLYADASIAFDYQGEMYEASSKEYRYSDAQANLLADGTLTTNPIVYGVDSSTLSHSQGFSNVYLKTNFQAKLGYDRTFDEHTLSGTVIYDQQSSIRNIRNNSKKRQSILATAGYSYKDRYIFNAVVNYSGTSYLEKGSRFHTYPAASAAWVISNEQFMNKYSNTVDLLKLRASYGTSGWDGNSRHELYLQNYVGGGAYYFGDNINYAGGLTEGTLPVENLTIEKSAKMVTGFDLIMFKHKLSLSVDGFYEKRSDILVPSSTSISGVFGLDVSELNAGINVYKGINLALGWKDKIGDLDFGISSNMSYIKTTSVNSNQAYQEYDYLYHKGNQVGQSYGLEVLGFFNNQVEINNSPIQTFSNTLPGDIRYKDQNGDNRIDDKDIVKMYGTTSPEVYYGINLNLSYKRFEFSTNFQGAAGLTVNLLDSPLYAPLVNNGNISNTFLERETPWTPQNSMNATVPRLTTQSNANNYRNNSLWYRNGTFLKLRNINIAYTIPKSIFNAEMKIYLAGTNLFSVDNIKFADPEQLGATYPSLSSYWAGIKLNF
ncbi:SusC/RagA family TonB-linked outer membrane protein [Wocania ichthyoenteri]|uniref:SusC/RagA family TonB-linked outer membrane protein n=1 Tax=Wocania ichthyoenteri TaxID=1230531 RepID=UPI000691D2ED|nr:SusC/RagA family TonB-linked outer membrane protein [Wocania ichthyoenteri]